MVSGRALRAVGSQDVEHTSTSGVRRIDLNIQAISVNLSSVPPDGAETELEQARSELAETKAELADARAELAALRAALEALQRPTIAPASERGAATTTLQNVVVTETVPPNDPSGARRKSERLPCEFEVEFAHDTHFIAGVSSDMSTGGLFVATYHSLPVGSAVTVAFDLPSGHRVEARGEVRWARETEKGDSRPGLGIAFTELSDAALARIVDFCRDKPPLCFEV